MTGDPSACAGVCREMKSLSFNTSSKLTVWMPTARDRNQWATMVENSLRLKEGSYRGRGNSRTGGNRREHNANDFHVSEQDRADWIRTMQHFMAMGIAVSDWMMH